MRMRTRAARPPRPAAPGTSIPADLLLAQDPRTASDILGALIDRYLEAVDPGAKKPQVQILRALAKNPNTPPMGLARLSWGYPWEVAQNQAIPCRCEDDAAFLYCLSPEAQRALVGDVAEDGEEPDDGDPWGEPDDGDPWGEEP